MAAAVTLAERGVPVTVFESGPVPGGRARRVNTAQDTSSTTASTSSSAPTRHARLMRVGVGVRPCAAALAARAALRRVSPCARRLPPARPLAALATGVPRRAPRRRALHGSPPQQRISRRARDTVEQLLERIARRRIGECPLWGPLCVSALNTPLEQLRPTCFSRVLRDTLAGAAARATCCCRASISRALSRAGGAFVRAHGGEVALRRARDRSSHGLKEHRRHHRRGRPAPA